MWLGGLARATATRHDDHVWPLVIVPLVLFVGAIVGGTLVARRRGYKMGGKVVVSCRESHLFTTIWVPGMSFKSVRLGWWRRLQRCPVGRHWTLIVPVKDATLTAEERRLAAQHHDVWLP